MISVTTVHASMLPLGKRFLDACATHTGLTCAVRIYFYQFLTGTFSLISQLLKKAIPSYVVYLLTQNALRHSFDVQIFNRNNVKFFDQLRRNFMRLKKPCEWQTGLFRGKRVPQVRRADAKRFINFVRFTPKLNINGTILLLTLSI